MPSLWLETVFRLLVSVHHVCDNGGNEPVFL